MAFVKAKPNQNIESLISAFSSKVYFEGIMDIHKEKQHFTKPSVVNREKRKRKAFLSARGHDKW